MLYIRVGAVDDAAADRVDRPVVKLQYFCRNCGQSVDGDDTDTKSCISRTNYTDDQGSYQQYATPYIKYDPTLPRVSNISCPNTKCKRKPEQPGDVIYVKYDGNNMRFLYHCTYCETFWKSGDSRAVVPSTRSEYTRTTEKRNM